MKKLQVLGTGCPKCQKLAEAVTSAADALGIEYELEKITDIAQILTFGVMATPALAVDRQVKVSGRIPSIPELQDLIR